MTANFFLYIYTTIFSSTNAYSAYTTSCIMIREKEWFSRRFR